MSFGGKKWVRRRRWVRVMRRRLDIPDWGYQVNAVGSSRAKTSSGVGRDANEGQNALSGTSLDDYRAFAEALAMTDADPGRLTSPLVLDGITLRLAWVRSPVQREMGPQPA